MAGDVVRGCSAYSASRTAGGALTGQACGCLLATAGRRFVLALAGALAALTMFGSAGAQANPYVVHICDAAGGYRVNAISFASGGANMGGYNACPGDAWGHRVGSPG